MNVEAIAGGLRVAVPEVDPGIKRVGVLIEVPATTVVGVKFTPAIVSLGATVVDVHVAVIPFDALVVSTLVTVPAPAFCQVAAVPLVAVRTCPEVGAVAEDTTTVVVAERRAVATVLSPVFVPEMFAVPVTTMAGVDEPEIATPFN